MGRVVGYKLGVRVHMMFIRSYRYDGVDRTSRVERDPNEQCAGLMYSTKTLTFGSANSTNA